jgi:hypothetical protein
LKIKWKLKEKPIFSRPVKQYARTHWLHQMTKPENQEHWTSRGASKRDS